MIKNLSIFLFVILLIPFVLQAQNKNVVPKAKVVMDTEERAHTSTNNSVAAANYVVVDSMANAYGPAISVINPLVYDPASNVVAFLHRGHSSYAAGSGQLWYNYSTDMGVTWPRVGPVNTAPISARYPSMAISNPTKGDITATTAVFSWPELNPGAFGNLGFGADQPVGAGTTFADTIIGSYSSQVPAWASDNSAWVFWGSDNQTDNSYEIFRTEDFATVTSTIIPEDVFGAGGGNICFGGVSFEGNLTLGFMATYDDPDTNKPIPFGWYPGILTSTDNGVTWNSEVVDFRTIPALSAYDQLCDYDEASGTIRFDGDINVDKNGYVHLALGVTDTATTPWTHSMVDVYQTASGWDATIVANLTGDVYTLYANGPGLGQMGYSPYLAFDAAREVMAYQWVDKGVADSCDLFFAYKALGDAAWSTPMNLTETPDDNSQSHLANMLAGTAPNYTAFSMYGLVKSLSRDVGTTTDAFIAPVTFTVTGVGDGDMLVNSFALEQNYPNPFNPSTSIKYTISERSNVSLKVFDMLGREVSVLVNKAQEAGSYSVNFDASKLSSGVYVYSINAGNYSATKKMMLMK